MIPPTNLDLFAGIPVADYAAALSWYQQLLGSEPSFFPNDREAVWESRSKLGRADWVRMKLVPQFESRVPDPLGDQLPALLSPGRMAAPAIGIDLLIFIGECRRV